MSGYKMTYQPKGFRSSMGGGDETVLSDRAAGRGRTADTVRLSIGGVAPPLSVNDTLSISVSK